MTGWLIAAALAGAVLGFPLGWHAANQAHPRRPQGPTMTRPLTRSQREVLLLAANGNSNTAIAAWRGVTPHSVAEILSAAYRRLGATDRAQAVAIALAIGELGIHQIRIPNQTREQAA